MGEKHPSMFHIKTSEHMKKWRMVFQVAMIVGMMTCLLTLFVRENSRLKKEAMDELKTKWDQWNQIQEDLKNVQLPHQHPWTVLVNRWNSMIETNQHHLEKRANLLNQTLFSF